MELRHIVRGTRLRIIVRTIGDQDCFDEYDAVYQDVHDLTNETSFEVKCAEFSSNYSKYHRHSTLEMSFTGGPSVYTFFGRPIEKLSNDLIVIEQTTNIETLNRRKYQRDEIRVEVRLYSLSEDMLSQTRHNRPGTMPLLLDVSFDISAGGMCIVTNSSLHEKHDPFYLVEFYLSDKDWFLIPARLVRRSNNPRSKVGKNDYGFQFIYHEASDDMSRLTKAILSRKLSFIR